ncbi:MAG: hypothetical protein KDJ29_16070 [Hyphomicrobiales bacterium]|nr:hypothetical protein [Hyphomicrobiales bacterium]
MAAQFLLSLALLTLLDGSPARLLPGQDADGKKPVIVDFFVPVAETDPTNPFKRKKQPAVSGSAPSVGTSSDVSPFSRKDGPIEATQGGCGSDSALSRAELKKPDLAQSLCDGEFADLDQKWVFVVAYVKGFNDLLEERGSFLDPTGNCTRAAEPRHSLDLIYQAIDTLRGKGDRFDENADMTKMLQPFREDWRRLPFILYELSVWQREGKLDAMSVASNSLCIDPSFKLFWRQALKFSQRLPGTVE